MTLLPGQSYGVNNNKDEGIQKENIISHTMARVSTPWFHWDTDNAPKCSTNKLSCCKRPRPATLRDHDWLFRVCSCDWLPTDCGKTPAQCQHWQKLSHNHVILTFNLVLHHVWYLATHRNGWKMLKSFQLIDHQTMMVTGEHKHRKLPICILAELTSSWRAVLARQKDGYWAVQCGVGADT